MILTVTTERAALSAIRFGNGKRQLVVLPGMSTRSICESAAVVERQYARFAPTHTVTVLDVRADLPDGYTIPDMVADAETAMDTLGIADADVFGASMGGVMALTLAAGFPHRVARLAVSSTSPCPDANNRVAFSTWASLCEAADANALRNDMVERVYSVAYRERYAAAFAMLGQTDTPDDLHRLRVQALAELHYDVTDRLPKIACPCLVFGAEDDRVMEYASSVTLSKMLNCPLISFPHAAHAVYDENPHFLDRLQTFFA